ncbi:MAG: methyltransferase domain-containing protein [Verrucomicrobia bacterium]|nr:methyltransferase domain-containing protein [Verrucomicrobiota bacterium]
MNSPTISRLHWSCSDITPEGWINSDIVQRPGIDVCGDIRKGLPLGNESFDYIVSHHGLQDLGIYEQVPALQELLRVLRPGGVLRLGLPDLDKAIAAYQRGQRDHFLIWDWDTISGNFITHILWYGLTRTLFTVEFTEELLRKAGFGEVRRVAYRQTVSVYPEIVALDNREAESFYVEAFK